MSLLPDVMEELDLPPGGSAASNSPRRKSRIKRNLNSVTDATPPVLTEILEPETKTSSPTEEDVFWDRKSIVFVSWYWPSCIVVGALLGAILAGR